MTTEYTEEAQLIDASEPEAGGRALRALSWMGNLYRRMSLSMVLSILLHLGILAAAALALVYGGKGDNMFSSREIRVSLRGADDVESGDNAEGDGHKDKGDPAKAKADQENIQDEAVKKLQDQQKDQAKQTSKDISKDAAKTINTAAAADRAAAESAAGKKSAADAAKRNQQDANRDAKAGSQKQKHDAAAAAEARRRAEAAKRSGRHVKVQAGGGGEPIFNPPPEDAKYIAYVVDRSTSMGGTLHIVVGHLIEAINSLPEDKSFFVVFYHHGATPMNPIKMYKATKANKKTAEAFIKGISPGGFTNPIPAMRIAMKVTPKPHLVYLLTDGQFDDSAATDIQAMNPHKEARIDTICFLNQSGEPILKRIAKNNGGSYTFVSH